MVLATYQGEEFLAHQLDSLLAQDYTGWRLLIRDDGSRDRTMEIAATYAARDPRIRLLPADTCNLGAVGNFGHLLQAAYDEGARYVLLMDQDDIWLPQKISAELAAMKAAELRSGRETPVLVHTDLALVDGAGRLVEPSFMRYQRIRNEAEVPLRTLLVLNYVTGCTTLVNRPLLELALPIFSAAMMHDWWLALLAASAGTIVHLPQPTVLYRQHGANQVGAKGLRQGLSSALFIIRTRGTPENPFVRTVQQAAALESRLRERGLFQPEKAHHALISRFIALFVRPLPWYQRLIGIGRLRLRRQWFVRQWLLYLYAALWSLPGIKAEQRREGGGSGP